MKIAYKSLLLILPLTVALSGCERDADTTEPLQTSAQNDLVGYDPSGCHLIQSFGEGVKPRMVSTISEDEIIMKVSAQRRGSNGRYLSETAGLLLSPSQSYDMIKEFDRYNLGVGGMLTVPNQEGTGANQTGGRVILDFSEVGSVTMKNMLFTDIDADEEGSKVELYSNTGQLLLKKELWVTGDKGSGFVNFDSQPGVTKIVVTFGSERSRTGSGTIARLQMCVYGKGICASNCYVGVNTMWLQYLGDKVTNIKVGASNTGVLYNGHGIKPGTIFKVQGITGDKLMIETNRRQIQTIDLLCTESSGLKKNYGMFKVVAARGNSSYQICLQD